MYKDPILQELRDLRLELEAIYKNDPEKYYAYIEELQKKYKNRLVSGKAKPALKFEKVS